jgi:aspartyl/glutamyl-tRNA(Asn/Gln) amidotransferase C subunit
MALTSEAVVRLARQARFDLSAAEIERFRAELSAVLDQMRLLAELEPVADEPVVTETAARLRADDCGSDSLRLPLDQLTTHLVAGFFTVPRVISAADRVGP